MELWGALRVDFESGLVVMAVRDVSCVEYVCVLGHAGLEAACVSHRPNFKSEYRPSFFFMYSGTIIPGSRDAVSSRTR